MPGISNLDFAVCRQQPSVYAVALCRRALVVHVLALVLPIMLLVQQCSGKTMHTTGPGSHVAMARQLGRGWKQARIQHRFVAELQASQTELQWSADLVNVTRNLGANNPSV